MLDLRDRVVVLGGLIDDTFTDSEQKVPVLGDLPVLGHLDEPGTDHVPDPYYTRDFDGALDLVERCAEALLDRLDAG